MLCQTDLLFDTSDFPPRWQCGEWSTAHGWTHIAADLAIFFAYFAIPLLIVRTIWNRKDIPFPTVGWLFAGFILSCGAVHLVEAIIFYTPVYRFSALLKVITALVSIATVVAMARFLPNAIELPGLRTINDKLEDRNEELDHFATIAAHDMKAPLRAIGNLATFIQEDCAETMPDDSKEHLALIQDRTRRLDLMLDGLLEYARAGGNAPPSTVDLNSIAQATIELLAVPKEFTVEATNLPTVTASPEALSLIFRNLISNAIKHHDRETGHIKITASSLGSDDLISFIDDGPGVPETFKDSAFEMFSTAKAQNENDGAGMGLATILKAAERFGGSVTLEPSDGRGATFTLRIPKASAALQPAPDTQAADVLP